MTRWRLPADPVAARRIVVGFAALLVVVYIAGILTTTGTRGPLVQGDGRSYFVYLPSLVLDGDVDLQNQFAVLQPEGDTAFPFGVGYQGRARNPFPIAPAILWLPGYVGGLSIDIVTGGLPGDEQPIGFGAGAVLGTAAWSILLVGIGADITRRLAQRTAGGAAAHAAMAALAATMLAWIATPALYYTLITPLYSHAPAWFAVSLMLWYAWRAIDESRAGLWIASGLAAGWVMAIRLQDAPLLVVPTALLGLALYRTRSVSRALQLSSAWVGAMALGYLAQAVTWYWLHGTWIPYGDFGSPVVPDAGKIAAILFSVGLEGWFSWTPVVVPALAGLGLLAARGDQQTTRWLAGAGLVAVLGMIAIDAIHPYRAGASFGGRRYVSVTPLLAVGLATLLGHTPGARVRSAAWVGLPLLAFANLCLLLAYELMVIRHDYYPALWQVVRYAAGLGVP